MFKYIGGNTIKNAIKTSNKIISSNKIPIINFAIEESNNKNKIYQEHQNLLNSIDKRYKIAIKLSSFEFDNKCLQNLIEESSKRNIQIIIDAEKNINNNEYQLISNQLMFKYNKFSPNVVKTYQMYRKDSLQNLKDDINFFETNDIYLPTKLVRGAYWNSEREDGHLYKNKYETDVNYNKAIIYLSERMNKNYNILATHNKESINLGKLMNNYNNKKIFDFAHLLGMGEHNYKNQNENENIHVYVPYGPYKEMIPYLLRRLYENIDTIKYML